MTWIVLATEDEVSEQVGLSLAAEANLEVGQCLRKGGNGYLRARIPNFLQMAQRQPVVVITDLDVARCPPELRNSFVGRRVAPASFVLRVAVREIESWLLADHPAMRSLIGPGGVLPPRPDELPDPKSLLLMLARRAPRRMREDLIKLRGAVASQGLGYNARLSQFVKEEWRPERASSRSDSLARARRQLQRLSESAAGAC